MSETRIKVRANRMTGELEVEGPPSAVAEWWEKLWPELSQPQGIQNSSQSNLARVARLPTTSEALPDVFGEYFAEFRSGITDVDKVLVAGAYLQGRDPDRAFTTKAVNQALLDQNIKVANASENVRRLMQTKRVFVVSDGKYRVSAVGLDHLNSLKAEA